MSRENTLDHLQNYVDSPLKQEQLYKRTLLVLVISQIFSGAGLAAGVTVGALLAEEMLGTESFGGIPAALLTLGSALAAMIVGRLSQRYGRRIGLSAGFLAGGIGAVGVVLSAMYNHIPMLFVSLFIYGAGFSTNMQTRYAGTDLAKPTQRAKAISVAMVSTTFGAVAGPNLVDPMGRFAEPIGVPALGGIFILAAAAFIVSGLILLMFLKPDPFMVAKAIAETKRREPGFPSEVHVKTNQRGIIVGATVMVLSLIVMTGIMTMTPVYMKHHGHGLGEVGLVISIHIGAMYLPSLVTGVLVDKLGRGMMSIASGYVLLISGIVAAVVPAESLLGLIIALALLGLGWNLGLISGTALVVDSTPPVSRAKTQGTVDVLIALSGASSGALSGVVLANSNYAVLSLGGGFLSLILIPIVLWSRRK